MTDTTFKVPTNEEAEERLAPPLTSELERAEVAVRVRELQAAQDRPDAGEATVMKAAEDLRSGRALMDQPAAGSPAAASPPTPSTAPMAAQPSAEPSPAKAVVVDAAAAFPANDGPGALDQSIPSFLSTPVAAEPAQARTVVNDTVPVEPPKRRHRIIGARLAVLAISLAGIGSLAGYEWGDPLVARPLAELRDAFPDLRVSVADLRDAIEARTRSVAAIFADTTDDRSPSVAAPIEPERHAAASRAPSPATSDEGDVAIGAGLLALDPAERAAAAAGADRPISTSIDDTRIAFGRFVHLMRRQRGFSIEKLADEAALEVGELVRIEEDLDYTPEPRTVYQLARTFDVPQQGLMQLAGLAVPKDAGFRQEAIRFAARSESIQKLSREEKAALDAFIAVLSQRQDR